MANALHGSQRLEDGIHTVVAFSFANAAARTSGSVTVYVDGVPASRAVQASDVGKVARQLDDDSFWILVDDSPLTWTQLIVSLSASPPVDVDANPAAAGSSTAGSRADHKHDVATAAPVATGTANAEGSAASVARSDHVHRTLVEVQDGGAAVASRPKINFVGATVVDDGGGDRVTVTISAGSLSNVAPVDVTKSAASAGVAAEASRQDHKHDVSTAVAGAIAVGDSAAEGTATSLARSDHRHSLAAPAAPVDVTKAAASAGASTNVARADHKHDVSTAAAVSLSAPGANAEGTATSLARSDHTHAIPVQSGALVFGNGSVSATTTTRYASPGFDPGTAPIAAPQIRAPRAGTIKNLHVRHNTPAGNGNAIVYTFRKNGAAQAVTVSLASTSANGADVANSFAVAQGDAIDVEITKAASVGTSPSDVTITAELA